MVLEHPVYSRIHIKPKVIQELLQTKALLRLQGISMGGLPDSISFSTQGNRYWHSVGVYHLLEKFHAPEEEQIAGLLHDISHTTFSHVIDWVFDSKDTETYQDSQHHNKKEDQELVTILEKYGHDIEAILDLERYKILDQEIPDLCVDRIDYALIEFSKEMAMRCLSDLHILDSQFYFTDPGIAYFFAKGFLNRQIKNWGSQDAVNRYHLLAALLKHGLKKGILTEADFQQNEDYVLKKLLISGDTYLKKGYEILSIRPLPEFSDQLITQTKKFRYVDPFVQEQGKLVRLSKISQKFKTELKDARRQNALGVEIQILN